MWQPTSVTYSDSKLYVTALTMAVARRWHDVLATLCVVGQIGPIPQIDSLPLLLARRQILGSAIGGIAQTQEMLDFCAQRNILPEVEMIRMAPKSTRKNPDAAFSERPLARST